MDCKPPGFSVHGILQARILHFFLQGIFRTQGVTRKLLQLLHWQVAFFFFFCTTEPPGKLPLPASVGLSFKLYFKPWKQASQKLSPCPGSCSCHGD